MGVIGQSVKRVEDQRFITGKGRYTDDITLPNSTFAALVRSPHAHAAIKSVDTTAAAAASGVVAIFTGADLEAEGVGGLPCGWQVDFKNGDTMKEPAHPVLAATKVRHVGDPVAIVLAESREQAADAAELVAVDYEVLDAVVAATQATAEGAPQLFDDVPNNTPFDWELGDQAATDAALASAAHVTTLEYDNQRLIPNAIEPRCAIGDYDGARDHYTLYTSSQNPHVIRLLMTAFVLGLPEHKVRVVSPDVGGGFGSKIFHYAEEVLVTWCSRQIGRPVKWTASRSEAFLTDAHGRDHHTKVDLGPRRRREISSACGSKTVRQLGARILSTFCAVRAYVSLRHALAGAVHDPSGLRRCPLVSSPNTTPVDALRGAGTPRGHVRPRAHC